MAEVAAALGSSPAQALLLWGLRRGTSLVPKSATAARVRENAAVLRLPPPGRAEAAQLARLDALAPQARRVTGAYFVGRESPRHKYASMEDLWGVES